MPANLSFGLNVLKVTPFIWIYVVFVGNFQVYVIWNVFYLRQTKHTISQVTEMYITRYKFKGDVKHIIHNNPYSKVHGANMGPLGSCWPQMGPVLAPWTLLSGNQYWAPSVCMIGAGDDVP